MAEAAADDVAEGIGKGVYIPETPLMQHKVDDIDIPLPDPRAGKSPHTVLGGRIGENGVLYRQSATFAESSWSLANGKKFLGVESIGQHIIVRQYIRILISIFFSLTFYKRGGQHQNQ